MYSGGRGISEEPSSPASHSPRVRGTVAAGLDSRRCVGAGADRAERSTELAMIRSRAYELWNSRTRLYLHRIGQSPLEATFATPHKFLDARSSTSVPLHTLNKHVDFQVL